MLLQAELSSNITLESPALLILDYQCIGGWILLGARMSEQALTVNMCGSVG